VYVEIRMYPNVIDETTAATSNPKVGGKIRRFANKAAMRAILSRANNARASLKTDATLNQAVRAMARISSSARSRSHNDSVFAGVSVALPELEFILFMVVIDLRTRLVRAPHLAPAANSQYANGLGASESQYGV
jgi:hypothetical protein